MGKGSGAQHGSQAPHHGLVGPFDGLAVLVDAILYDMASGDDDIGDRRAAGGEDPAVDQFVILASE